MSRRVGKTLLLEKAYRRGDYLYFFVARKNMEFSEREHFTLVIDEFQEFLRVNPSSRFTDVRQGILV